MMAVVTDRRILERVVAIIRDAKPVERPIIPERVAPPARGGGQRKKLSPPPKVATGSEASPVVSGAASEVVGASSMAAPSPAQSRTPSGEGGVPAGSAAWGFDIDEMNREYALVLMGSKSVVYYERANAGLADAKRFLTIEAFAIWLRNRRTQVAGADGRVKAMTWAARWLDHPERRQYRGVEFWPDPHNAPGTAGFLNLWSGFAVKPAAVRDERRYSVFRDHLLNNVCNGNEALFRWVFAFFADIVQRPRNRPGTALVMRGRMGSGKTKVGEVFGRLFPQHYFLVDTPRYITGNFNAHMASCLLLQADEAVWAGDKTAEGRLKGLVTAEVQFIEAKGVDPIELRNFVRLVMTSNEDWVVPAGKDERRFAVIDVNPRCANSHTYFAEMEAELAAGGLEALLADLLAFDLNAVNLRAIPKTDALGDQKIRSLDSVESWCFGRLVAGTGTRDASEWPKDIGADALYSDYIGTAEKIGVRRKKPQHVFGSILRKVMPGLIRKRPGSGSERPWVYQLPVLGDARRQFEDILGQRVDWSSYGPPQGDTATEQPEEDFFDIIGRQMRLRPSVTNSRPDSRANPQFYAADRPSGEVRAECTR
jgi:hypothetical protein